MLPSSGLRTTTSSTGCPALRMWLMNTGAAYQVVDRDVEEALDLGGVQVEGQDAVGPGGGEQVGDQLGRDRHAALVLAVLPGVAVVRQHGRDPGRAGPLEGVEDDSSSIRFSFTGGQVGWTRNTSRPRTSSSMRTDGLAVGEWTRA